VGHFMPQRSRAIDNAAEKYHTGVDTQVLHLSMEASNEVPGGSHCRSQPTYACDRGDCRNPTNGDDSTASPIQHAGQHQVDKFNGREWADSNLKCNTLPIKGEYGTSI